MADNFLAGLQVLIGKDQGETRYVLHSEDRRARILLKPGPQVARHTKTPETWVSYYFQ